MPRTCSRCPSVSNVPGSRLLIVTLRRMVCRASPAVNPTRPERAPFDRPSSSCGDLHAARHDVDDAAEAARHHAVDGQPHHLDVAQHHAVDRRDPVIARPIAEIAGQAAVGIVHQDVGLRTGLERGRAALRRRDVGGDRGDGCAERTDFRCGAFQRVALARHDGDGDALARERQRTSLAEPAARPAQQRFPSGDPQVHAALRPQT